MDILNRIYTGWRDLLDNKSDPRTKDWLLMDSPFPTIAISAMYIFSVKIIGPQIMKNRKPYNAKRLQFYYNIFHLIINIYLFYEACTNAWLVNYSFRCQPVDFSMIGTPYRIARGCWLYYISKFTDFFETWIFVLLKRFDMINLYHVAHHSIMPISVWMGVKFLAGGHSTFFGFVNTFVHIVIYTYFVTITLFPKAKTTISFFWKPFYPYFQIGQFTLIFIHAFQLVFSNECNYPMSFVYFIGFHALLFYVLVRSKMKTDKLKLMEFQKHEEEKFNSNKKSEKFRTIGDTIQSTSEIIRHRFNFNT